MLPPESPLNTQQFKRPSVFNWTATYRSDSTVVTPYERCQTNNSENVNAFRICSAKFRYLSSYDWQVGVLPARGEGAAPEPELRRQQDPQGRLVRVQLRRQEREARVRQKLEVGSSQASNTSLSLSTAIGANINHFNQHYPLYFEPYGLQNPYLPAMSFTPLHYNCP